MPRDGRKISYALIFIMYTRICGHFVILIGRVARVISAQKGWNRFVKEKELKATHDTVFFSLNECRDGKFYVIGVVYKGEEAIVAR